MPRLRPLCWLSLPCLLLTGCGRDEAPLFTLVPPEASGVRFANMLVERDGLNVLDYEYFYNGGGVAVGDINGDSLPDVYFTANMGPNALYLNEGSFRFEDITERAGVAGGSGWKTGVTMADVNGDGLLDIYVCKSGNVREDMRRNELYVNNGDLTFTEQAADYGLDDPSYSTHAAFFDYDRDGDLDLYLLNHNIRRLTQFDADLVRKMRDPFAGDKLYRNEGGRFVDVSVQAGIIGNPIGFGLSATVADIDQDGWPDVYVANDYIEDDYLYINNGDGTFSERIRDFLSHTSYSSMGVDIADYNNDALPDILTLDMLPESNERRKLLDGPAGYDEYRQMLDHGYHHQFMYNMLHLNNGVGLFSEIGQLAGISTTDWSWAALLADYDNDGLKDLFVTNGYRRDYTNLDFWEYTIPAYVDEAARRGEKPGVMDLVSRMPSSVFKSYVFRNRGDLTFEPATEQWGITRTSLSSGAAYADFDRDGDLDLAVNNVDEPAFLYRNEAGSLTSHQYLKLRLEGEGGNRFGIGAKAFVTTPDGRTLYQEMFPVRGYQSSVEPVLLFGLGNAESVDVRVVWPDGRQQVFQNVAAGQVLTLRQREGGWPAGEMVTEPVATTFTLLSDRLGLDFVHQEDTFVDFRREPLLPHMLSRLGPALAHADVNRDGLEDVYVGGAHGQAGALYLQQADGRFKHAPVPDFTTHAAYENVDALFFDADNDGDPDLYVVSGGSLPDTSSTRYQDRFYANNGFGAFSYQAGILPEMPASGGAVAADDFDGDGDLDLFVGGRLLPGRYPLPPRSYLLENTGGRFIDITEQASESLLKPGLVTDATWADVDGDLRNELILAGEWMPIRVFRNNGGRAFAEITDEVGLGHTHGWWNCLQAADLDGDGDLDLVAGNRGLNAQIQASREEPATLHAADFEGNGTVDPILSYYIQGRGYPVASRDELFDQMPALADRFPSYASYANATITDILSEEQFRRAFVLQAYEFASSVFENDGEGTFRQHRLPVEAQFAPVNSALVQDLDGDGVPDILLAGNNFGTRPQAGRQDAGRGLLLRGRSGLRFDPVPSAASGFVAPGDVRRLALLSTRNGPVVIVANNDAGLAAFAVQQPMIAIN